MNSVLSVNTNNINNTRAVNNTRLVFVNVKAGRYILALLPLRVEPLSPTARATALLERRSRAPHLATALGCSKSIHTSATVLLKVEPHIATVLLTWRANTSNVHMQLLDSGV